MCGLVGIIGNVSLSKFHLKFFIEALYADALRGMHSTGVTRIGMDKSVEHFKKALPASDYLDLKTTDEFLLRSSNPQALLGHNRHATRGKIIDRNAHPFHYGDITLMHNGSLTSMFGLPDQTKFDVDSEAIAYSVNKIGIEETVKILDGAFTLVYHDSSDNSVNIIRNEERPFTFGKLKNEKTLAFASEAQMLRWISGRTNNEMEKIYTLPIGKLMKIELSKSDITNYTLTDMELKATEDWYGSYPRYNRGWRDKKKKEPQKNNIIAAPDTKNRRQRRINVALKKAGLSLGKTIEFCALEYKYYNSGKGKLGKNGIIEGVMIGEPWYDILVHNVHEDKYIDGATYTGEISSCCTNKLTNGAEVISVYVMNILQVPEKPIETQADDDSPPFEAGDTEDKRDDDNKLYLPGFRGALMSLKEFEYATKYGCCQCTGNLDSKEAGDIHWVDNFTPMCPSCKDQWDDWSSGEDDGELSTAMIKMQDKLLN